MAVKTFNEQLESVQAAIEAIEGGSQSYTIQTPGGSRTVSRADLKTLYEREERLMPKAQRESAGRGVRVRYGVPT